MPTAMQYITLLIMGILSGAEIDMFVPSFPELREVFGLSAFMVELTLGINLAAHCITSLFVGALGDKYGRKPIIQVGLFIFIIGSILSVCAVEYWHLLLGRALQGIGISAPVVLSFVVIFDIYPIDKQQAIMGKLNGTVTFAMAFAPVIGSYVSLYFHWRGNFMALLLLGLLSFGLCTLFIPAGKKNPDVTASLKEYVSIFKSPKAFYYIATIVWMIIPYWSFVGLSPILYMNDLGVSLAHFGFYQGSLCLIFSFLSFTSGIWLKKFGQKKCFLFSLAMLIAFVIVNIFMIIYKTTDPLVITIFMQLLSMGVIFPITIMYPLSLETVPNSQGKIAALIASGRMIFTALVLQIVGYVYNGTYTPIAISMCALLFLTFWYGYKLSHYENIFIKAETHFNKIS